MIVTILSIIAGISLIANYFLAIILRGAMLSRDQEAEAASKEIHPLTGWEIESIRRRVAKVGYRGINLSEIFSLILTLREIQKGLYTDEDPWLPADPYEDINLAIDELPPER